MGANYICTTCGIIGQPKKIIPGSFWMELGLWILVCVPGLIYSIWRLTSGYKACPECETRASMLSLYTPAGEMAFRKFHPNKVLD
jgi:hypothetical protein